jgi:hypothetical protein
MSRRKRTAASWLRQAICLLASTVLTGERIVTPRQKRVRRLLLGRASKAVACERRRLGAGGTP